MKVWTTTFPTLKRLGWSSSSSSSKGSMDLSKWCCTFHSQMQSPVFASSQLCFSMACAKPLLQNLNTHVPANTVEKPQETRSEMIIYDQVSWIRKSCKILQMYFFRVTTLPSKHHHSGLRISARRVDEGGAVDHAKRLGSQHTVIRIHYLSHHASPMVVPDGAHCSFTEWSNLGIIISATRR